VIYTGTESWQFSWIDIIVELISGSGFVWLLNEIWISCVYVIAAWRMVVIIKQKNLSVYSHTKENYCSHYFVFDCLLLNTDFFFIVLTIYSWISKEIFIFKQLDVIPLYISRHSIWFSIKIVIICIWFFSVL
jgi:hypothetical protein